MLEAKEPGNSAHRDKIKGDREDEATSSETLSDVDAETAASGTSHDSRLQSPDSTPASEGAGDLADGSREGGPM